MKKLLVTLFVLCFIYNPGFSQDTSIDIENPMNNRPQQYEVLGVEVEGLTTSREEFVIGTSGLQVGTQITIPGQDLSRAIKSLHRTGLFSDVEIIETDREPGGIYLKIVVQEQPRLEGFEIHGTKRSHRKDLEEEITLLRGYAVTESSLAQARNTIQRYYDDKGYWYTNIEVEKSQPDTVRNRVTVHFNIDP
ncbi:MAG: hypothetical protein GWN00_14020, partial [Aliifodinibius sp.]|nr:hypothetical protein [Fodinibius sp.]NIV12242.1 hypothetical protein [Fodinibius sp.]NIY25883.1 hypothetical protein [Fodinibius sp.]